LKKKYFSTHRLTKQQTTSFWSQGILGVKALSKAIGWMDMPFVEKR
jgi:hypothetical protein